MMMASIINKTKTKSITRLFVFFIVQRNSTRRRGLVRDCATRRQSNFIFKFDFKKGKIATTKAYEYLVEFSKKANLTYYKI